MNTVTTARPRLAVAGDLTLTDSVLEGVRREGAERWFGQLSLDLLSDVRGLVCNLEVSPGDGGHPAPGKVILTSSAEALAALPALRILAVTIANNHIMDWGASRAAATAMALYQLGIVSTGLAPQVDGGSLAARAGSPPASTQAADRSTTRAPGGERIHVGGAEKNAVAPARLEVDGWRIGVLAYADETSGAFVRDKRPERGTMAAPSTHAPREESDADERHLGFEVRKLQIDRAREDVSQLAREVDAVFVSLHAGFEQVPYPEPDLVRTARRLVEAGAALVFGHHPHCVRGIERHGDGWIAFGLGNFITPDHVALKDGREVLIPRIERNRVGAVLVVEPAGRGRVDITDIRFVRTDREGRPKRLTGAQALRWRRALERLSEPLARPDYEVFHARRVASVRRSYALEFGLAKAARRKLSWSQVRTAWRLVTGRGGK